MIDERQTPDPVHDHLVLRHRAARLRSQAFHRWLGAVAARLRGRSDQDAGDDLVVGDVAIDKAGCIHPRR